MFISNSELEKSKVELRIFFIVGSLPACFNKREAGKRSCLFWVICMTLICIILCKEQCTGPQRNWSRFVILIVIYSLILSVSCKMMELTIYSQHSMTSTLTSFGVLNLKCANPYSLPMTLFD